MGSQYKISTRHHTARLRQDVREGAEQGRAASATLRLPLGGATFRRDASFESATFRGNAGFVSATFRGNAHFAAIKATRSFSLADTLFHSVPDFIQSEFAEAPRLDNSAIRPALVQPRRLWLSPFRVYKIAKPRFAQLRRALPRSLQFLCRPTIRVLIEPRLFYWATRRAVGNIYQRITDADRNLPAQWRALRRLAIASHDHEREHQFFAREIRALRFAGDWPSPLRKFNFVWSNKPKQRWYRNVFGWIDWWPLKFWDGRMWRGFARFCFGYIYQILSNFGQSIIRPFMLWCVIVAVFICIYLSGMREMETIAAQRYTANDAISSVFRPLNLTLLAYEKELPCTRGDGRNIVGLKHEITRGTNAFWEAFRISVANAVVVGDLGGTEGARLAYGCLYGLERLVPHGAVPEEKRGWFTTTYLPPAMATATRYQKALSAVLIFLFGLALRNMLKVR